MSEGAGGMKQIYRKLRGKLGRVRDYARAKKAAYYFAKRNQSVSNSPLRVGFLAQMPEVWDKLESVYNAMNENARIEPVIIVIPNRNLANNQFDVISEDNYFLVKYPKAIKGYDNGQWLDLRTLNLDYLFYQRCYENYLPSHLHTAKTIKYVKTCYVPYCYHVLCESQGYYRTSFFANLYQMYCCSGDALERVPAGLSERSAYLGYPVLENIQKEEMNRDCPVILWTPRWSCDKAYGGTSFFSYKDKILSLKTANNKLILRPHPLTFQEALRQEMMTPEEISAYKDSVAASGVEFDGNTLIEDTFKTTDILVTDMSSAIIPFFLTGKPIVYCTDPNLDFVGAFVDIIDCSYVVGSWDEVEKTVNDLVKGIDPKKEKRERLSKQYRETHNGAAERIVNHILEDATNKTKK